MPTDNTSNPLVKHTPTESSTDVFLKSIQEAEKIAEYVVNSETFGASFEKMVPDLDKDGNPKTNEEGDIKYVTVKSKADVISAILLGKELGIQPMAAISLGKLLNADAYFKVIKGRSLGLDPVSSIQNISVINTSAGKTIHTGVHVISKAIIDAGVDIEILEDATPVYSYVNYKNKEDLGTELNPDWFVVSSATSKEALQKAITEKKIIVTRKIVTKRTTITFARKGRKPMTISYTLQQATDAGLYMGVNSVTGEEVKGKANWNNHPETHLRGRVISIGGRIIAADKLQGVYSSDELQDFTNYEIIEDEPKEQTGTQNDENSNQPE
jgi:hypothetical protein